MKLSQMEPVPAHDVKEGSIVKINPLIEIDVSQYQRIGKGPLGIGNSMDPKQIGVEMKVFIVEKNSGYVQTHAYNYGRYTLLVKGVDYT